MIRYSFRSFFSVAAFAFLLLSVGGFTGNVKADEPVKSTIAVLSHTDFLPDATGVYDRRSWHGRDKNPNFVANNDMRTGDDQAYDNVSRPQGYAPESVGLPELLADSILEQLSKSKRFNPVERKSLRTALLEQRFGKQIAKSYMDRTLDKAIQDLDKLEVGSVGSIEDKAVAAKYNDLLHDFKDLGTAVGADILVLGNLHQLGSSIEMRQVPLSESGRQVQYKTAEARLRLRVIDASTSTILGADSLRLIVSEMLFKGGKENREDFEFMHQVAKEAANKILDIVFPAKIISLEPLVISRGINDGVAVGDSFRVVREGKELKESSGAVIARLKSNIGTVAASKVQETVSVVDIAEGSAFKVGDLVIRSVTEQNKDVGKSSASLNQIGSQQGAVGATKVLPRVAVGLVKTGSTAKTGHDAGEHVPTFTDTILTRLVKSRRFTVIDRQEVDQLLDEQLAQALAENRDMPSAMGTLKGCDYFVVGSLQNFSMEEQTIKLPNSTRVMEVLDGFAEGNMRIVDARSGDILESRKVSVQTQLDIQAGEDRLIAALADSYAAQVVASLLNVVYPIKIAAIDSAGTAYVNRGLDGLLKEGAVLNAYRQGQKVLDPDTGIELGSVENKIGQIELYQVEENRSLAKAIESSIMQSGDLLRVIEDGDRKPSPVAGYRSGNNLQVTDSAGSGSQSQQQVAQGGQKATLALVKITLNARQKFDDTSKMSAVQEGTMDQLTDIMADSLSKTNRFTMMERREIDQVIDEKTFQAVAAEVDIREYLKELQGADYLVVGELTNFYFHVLKKKVPYLKKPEVSITGFIEGNHRIVDSHTSAVIATDKVRIKKKFKSIGLEEIRTKLIDLYSLESANGIVQRIYPMKVLGVMADGTVFINRGTDADIKTGSTFSVQRPMASLIDKDTGISFGSGETPIGTIRVTMVEDARSRAEVVNGEIPVAGDVLRNGQAPPAAKKKEKIKVSW